MLQQNPASVFAAGYGSTADTDQTLTVISATGSGLAVTVTFTSTQQPAESPDNSSCDDWDITLYLVPGGSSYLIELPPPAYSPVYSPC